MVGIIRRRSSESFRASMKCASVFVIVPLLAACAVGYEDLGSTKYNDPVFNFLPPVGFSEVRVASNAYVVRFYSREDTSFDRQMDFALLRSAELTLRDGYTHFAVVRQAGQVDLTRMGRPPRQIIALTIKLLNENPSGFRLVLQDARALQETLRQKYALTAPS
jgi:hypothetical protein